MTVETINQFVTEFLEQNCTIGVRSDLLSEWKSEDTQSALVEVMKTPTKKTPTKKTPTKDPNRPKKNRSSYILYGMDHRPKAKDNLGDGAKPADVSRELGRMWTELKESNKSDDKALIAKYTTAAEADKERYAKEMEGYSPQEGEKTPSPTKKPTPAKTRKLPDFVPDKRPDPSTAAGASVINEMFGDEDGPEDVTVGQLPSADKSGKTLTTAYSVFKEFKYADAEKELGEGVKKTEITKFLAAAWKKVPKADRAPYQQKAEENKEA